MLITLYNESAYLEVLRKFPGRFIRLLKKKLLSLHNANLYISKTRCIF